MQLQQKIKLRTSRKARVRKYVRGTSDKLRLSVHFSGKHIYAQCIDDDAQRTMVFLSTLAKECRDKKLVPNIAGASAFGSLFGSKAAAAGVKAVVFDRNGRRYHGCVKAFADAVRACGLEF
ncbi:MAG: 50S ribosomal protein L18 [Opitutales bacterium]|nr:50S ribosomal protein L18 [Opitutales bacterium]